MYTYRIGVHLQPFIDELKELRDVGIDTYDISTGRTFQLKTALMWAINNLRYMECCLDGVLINWHVQYV